MTIIKRGCESWENKRVSGTKKMKSRKTLMRGERVVQTLITRVILMVPDPGKGRGVT